MYVCTSSTLINSSNQDSRPAERTGRRSRSTNLELKASDSSANPYLSLGGLIAAGLDGIERGLEPPPPVLADPAILGEEERLRAGAARLPESLGQAVANLERDEVLMEALGERLATSYVAVKKLDVEAFSQEDDAFEFRRHFVAY